MNREETINYIQQVKIGHLATSTDDQHPHVRPVAIHTFYKNKPYFFTISTTPKAAEMDQNANIEVAWTKLQDQSHVRMLGKAILETDEAIRSKFYEDNPMINRILPKEAAHLIRIYRIDPEKVFFADGLVPYTEVNWEAN